jgi:hypothetical protein
VGVEEKLEKREQSFLDNNGYIIEQIAGPGFACYNRQTKQVAYLPFVEVYDPRFQMVPLNPEAVDSSVILLPTAAKDYDTEAELLAEIQAHIHKWLDISPAMERFASYYVLYSWVYDKFHTAPYLRVTGDTGSGKTRFLDTIGRICYKPILVSGATTAAPIFRLLEHWHGTLVIDEADFAKSDTTQDIVKIMNSGFEKFRPVVRCNKENPKEIEIHRVFGPKVIASRYKFFDTALESRCLAEKIRPTARRLSRNLPKQFFEEEDAIRAKLLMYRFKNYDNEYPVEMQVEGIEPRLQQMVSSFLAVIAKDENMVAEFTTFIRKYQKELIEERADTVEGRIAAFIHHRYESGMSASPSEIAEALNTGSSKLEHLSPVRVARSVRSLGLEIKMVREGQKVSRQVVLDEEKLPSIFSRYIAGYIPPCNGCNASNLETDTPPPPLLQEPLNIPACPHTSVTSVTASTLLEMMSKQGGDVCPVHVQELLRESKLDAVTLREQLQILSKNGDIVEAGADYWMLPRK